MNNKGQLGFLKVIFFSILFIVFFVFALAPFSSVVINASNLTSFGTMGAWVISNFNVWVFLGFGLLVLVALVYGFSE